MRFMPYSGATAPVNCKPQNGPVQTFTSTGEHMRRPYLCHDNELLAGKVELLDDVSEYDL